MSHLTDKSLKIDDTEGLLILPNLSKSLGELAKLKLYKSLFAKRRSIFIEDYTVTNTPKLNNNPTQQLIY